MDDFIKSIKANLYDRATSPLFGIFAFSWLAWNYQFVLVFFSSLPVDEKIDYISTFLYPCIYSYALKGFLYPILTTAFFIFGYPYPAKFVYGFTKRKQNKLRELKQEIEGETPLTIKESREIRKEMVSLEQRYEDELEKKESEIKQLKEVINDVDKVPAPVKKTGKTSVRLTKKELPLSKQQLNLLKQISDHDKPLLQDLILWSDTDKVVTEYDLGELHKMKLITDHRLGNGKKAYSMTHEGRGALIEVNSLE